MEHTKARGERGVSVPEHFNDFPADLDAWTQAQRIDFQVWWATLPYGELFISSGQSAPAISALNAQLLAKFPRP